MQTKFKPFKSPCCGTVARGAVPGRLTVLILAVCVGASPSTPRAPAAETSDIVFEETLRAQGRLSRDWTVAGGDWVVRDGCLLNAEPGGGRVLVGETDWTDYTIEVTLQTRRPGPKPWSVARLLFRHEDTHNCYYLLLHRTGLLELGKEYRGQHMPSIASVRLDMTPLEAHRFSITVMAARITVLVDGRQVLNHEDDVPLARGAIGVDAFQRSLIQVTEFRVRGRALATARKETRQMAQNTLADLGYRPEGRGNIAVFVDADAPAGNSAPSDPEHLGRVLTEAGYGVTYLPPAALAMPAVLTPEHFDVAVLPYGAAFPRKAMAAFRRYLRRGGSFLSTGGYFGDLLYGGDTPDTQIRLRNAGFDDGLKGWTRTHPEVRGVVMRVESAQGEGAGQSASITVNDGTPVTWYSLQQRIDGIRPGTALQAVARVRTHGVTDGAGAYFALNYYRENGERITWNQSSGAQGSQTWHDRKLRGTVPPGTAYILINLILHGHGRAWFDDVRLRIAGEEIECLNTRDGDVKGPGNSLRVSPSQIGVFAPNYKLTDVVQARASVEQRVLDPDLVFPVKATGYSASGLFIGNGNPVAAVQHARPVYLIDALDRFGRLRGRLGTLVRNYKGPYPGSDWAVFGVNNVDLFAPERADMTRAFLDTIRAMLSRVYLAETHAQFACYRQGESVELEALVANFADEPRQTAVRFTVSRRDAPADTVFLHDAELQANAGKVTTASVTWAPDAFDTDIYDLRAELLIDDTVADVLRNAFVVWDEGRLRHGPRIGVGEGYVTWNGQPQFLCGTGDAGYPYHTESENPLVWDTQFRLLRDYGLRYYRCMHFMNGFPTAASLDDLDPSAKTKLRRLDALVYLAHRHGLMYLFQDNYQLQFARNDADALARRKHTLGLLAARYAEAPGFVFNSDHQEFIRARDARSHRAFQSFLQTKYGNAAEFAKAWQQGEEAPFGKVRFDENAARRADWRSARSLDTGEFLDSWREAWRRNHADAVHAGNANALLSQDFSLYWWPDFRWPAPDVMRRLDMVSAHYYGAEDGFLIRAKRCDMQSIGKPCGMTEFGILTHPAWDGHRDARLDAEDAEAFFMMAGHGALGMGLTMMSNWNWKEMKECIFPWAIAHHDLVPKPQLSAYRNMALLFRLVSPKYVSPETFLIVPSSLMRTARFRETEDALHNWIRELTRAHVRFGMIGEAYLDRLPAAAKLIVLPAAEPLLPDVRDTLAEFAARGGTVHTGADASSAARLVRGAGVETLPVEPVDPDVSVFSIPTQTQGVLFLLFNTSKETKSTEARHAGRAVRLTLAPRRTGAVLFDAQARVLAVEGQETAEIDGHPVWHGQGHFMLACLDGKDLARGSALLFVMAIGEGDATLRTWQRPRPTIEYGEFRDMRWHALETRSGDTRVRACGPLRSSIALACPAERLPEARQAVERLLAR